MKYGFFYIYPNFKKRSDMSGKKDIKSGFYFSSLIDANPFIKK